MEKTVSEYVKEILEAGFLMSLGTLDNDGVWVADVIYIFDEELNLYWLSLPTVRHSKAIGEHPQVAATVTAREAKGREFAIQISGLAAQVDGEHFEFGKRLERKRGLPEPKTPEELLAEGHRWYKLQPMRIDLIHNELFGYDKKHLDLSNNHS